MIELAIPSVKPAPSTIIIVYTLLYPKTFFNSSPLKLNKINYPNFRPG